VILGLSGRLYLRFHWSNLFETHAAHHGTERSICHIWIQNGWPSAKCEEGRRKLIEVSVVNGRIKSRPYRAGGNLRLRESFMFAIIGILVVFGAVAGGYFMGTGNLKVLMQPAELLIIVAPPSHRLGPKPASHPEKDCRWCGSCLRLDPIHQKNISNPSNDVRPAEPRP